MDISIKGNRKHKTRTNPFGPLITLKRKQRLKKDTFMFINEPFAGYYRNNFGLFSLKNWEDRDKYYWRKKTNADSI